MSTIPNTPADAAPQDERALFEAVAPAFQVDVKRNKIFPDAYQYAHTEHMWKFWLSARAALPAQAVAAVGDEPVILTQAQRQHYVALYGNLPTSIDSAHAVVDAVATAGFTNGYQAGKRDAVELAAPAQDVAPRDVTSILLHVEPGSDGMGHEVYAKSVEDVEAHLSALGSELEEWQLGIRRLGAQDVAPTDARVVMRFNIYPGGIINPDPRGMYVRYEDHAAALAAQPAAQPADVQDAERYREFFAAGLPITFLGHDYHDKAALDAAIDAARSRGDAS